MMLPLNPQQQEVMQRLDQLDLAPSVKRDFSMVLPWIWNEIWHTSVSLRKVMRTDNNYTRKELSRLSSALSNVYNNSELLERQFKRNIYNRFWTFSNTSNWCYRLNWQYLAQIMPNPEVEEYERLKAEYKLGMSLDN